MFFINGDFMESHFLHLVWHNYTHLGIVQRYVICNIILPSSSSSFGSFLQSTYIVYKFCHSSSVVCHQCPLSKCSSLTNNTSNSCDISDLFFWYLQKGKWVVHPLLLCALLFKQWSALCVETQSQH